MQYNAVIDMPITVFWLMLRNIDRLKADENHNYANRHAYIDRGETLVEYLEQMNTMRGEIIVMDNAEHKIVTMKDGTTKKIKEHVYERGAVFALKGLGKIR